MGIKGDDIAYAHAFQILQGHGTVQTLAGRTAVLPSLIEHGHNHVNTLGLSANGGNDPLQVHEVIVRAHGDLLAIHIIGAVVSAHITENIDVITANGFLNHTLALAISKAGTMYLDQEVLPFQAGRRAHIAGSGYILCMGAPF